MAVRIEQATRDDIPALLACAQALVATDAARYDATATNLDWAATTGAAYCDGILNNPDNVAFLATAETDVIGHLVGRLGRPSSVHPIRVADLESIYVDPAHRGRGVGQLLVDAFVAWATEKGADRTSVTVYAANDGAQRFYRRNGFAPASVVLHRLLR
jgi:GNAT superfamily N-acetyltransferase